ncbi:MAG TPA: biotin/lipoyl-containing protein [Bryobacteraceae bacterium]|nr:biotin/lipoyl-containing protein [Bryobacteraceae bacterium]
MKLRLEINGNPADLELAQNHEGVRFRLGDSAETAALAEQCEPGVYSILWEGRSYEARVEQGLEGLVVAIDGHRFEVRVHDPRRWSRGGSGGGVEGRQNLVAPMPGKVVRLLAAPGDPVERGQGVLVVEAMKMQNEMKAGKAGRVATIPVKEGDTVSAGEVLATIE